MFCVFQQKAQPMIEPFTFSVKNKKMMMEKDNEELSGKDVSEIYTQKNIKFVQPYLIWIKHRIRLICG